MAVARQKQTETEKSASFISVIERVIPNNAECVCGREPRKVRCRLISVQAPRTGQRRFERSFVTQARRPAVFRQRLPMQQEKSPPIDPDGRLHLASALKVSRYFAINSRPLVSCRSTSGS